MAKDKNKQAISDEPVRTDLNFGEVDQDTERQLKEVDPLQQIPTFVPGKPGFEEGMRLIGTYVGTKRVYSDKFTAGKRDEEGRLYRDLHVFNHKKHGKYGIWSVGSLGFVMGRIAPGELLSIEYTGLSDKPIKAGQSAPHTFKFSGVNLDLDTATMMNQGEMDERDALTPPGRRGVQGAENRI